MKANRLRKISWMFSSRNTDNLSLAHTELCAESSHTRGRKSLRCDDNSGIPGSYSLDIYLKNNLGISKMVLRLNFYSGMVQYWIGLRWR